MLTGGRVLVVLGLLLALATPACAQNTLAYVTRVAEGDLIYAEVAGRIEAVRYLGINAPVVDHPARGREPYAAVVRERNRQMVEGRWVRLAFEGDPRDAHGRLRAYVWVRDVFVNAAMLHYGYAEAAPPAANVRYAAYFKELEDGARRDRRGMWRYGDVIAYYRPGGLEQAGDTDYQDRTPTGGGGRVFSAPAPFLPVLTPGGSAPAPSGSAPPVTPPTTRTPPATMPRSGVGTRY